MTWNRDDWYAAILITILIIVGTVMALYLTGIWRPGQENTVIPFIQNKTGNYTIHSP